VLQETGFMGDRGQYWSILYKPGFYALFVLTLPDLILVILLNIVWQIGREDFVSYLVQLNIITLEEGKQKAAGKKFLITDYRDIRLQIFSTNFRRLTTCD